MNWDEIEGNWKQLKGKVRSQWGKLTDDDLDIINGKRTELAGLLQTRYGHAKEQAEREIDLWTEKLKQK
ncbi:MAG: CsbD family protein [Notoacmeibacter sp.]|nr:CsbD family protein [Notoacmeibacter sp.]